MSALLPLRHGLCIPGQNSGPGTTPLGRFSDITYTISQNPNERVEFQGSVIWIMYNLQSEALEITCVLGPFSFRQRREGKLCILQRREKKNSWKKVTQILLLRAPTEFQGSATELRFELTFSCKTNESFSCFNSPQVFRREQYSYYFSLQRINWIKFLHMVLECICYPKPYHFYYMLYGGIL